MNRNQPWYDKLTKPKNKARVFFELELLEYSKQPYCFSGAYCINLLSDIFVINSITTEIGTVCRIT